MSEITKFQKFRAVTINRAQINNAPYNPRKISSKSFDKLKKNIKSIGLVETLVYNSRTGNLVSGHQRLKILDLLEKRNDYEITVAEVDFDIKTEKEQNIFINNDTCQGEFDVEMIKALRDDIDFGAAGFSDVDLSNLSVEFDLEKHQNEDVEGIIEEFDEMKKEVKAKSKIENQSNPEHKDWKSAKKEIAQQNADQEREDYVVLTFDTWQEKEKFMRQFGFDPENRYVKGEMVRQFILKSV